MLGYLWGRKDILVHIMDCRQIEFSPTKSADRIDRVLRVVPRGLLMRMLAFTIHLLGARRQAVASLVGMREESVKTVIRLVMRDGFPAIRDRRRSEKVSITISAPSPPVAARREGEWYVVEFGTDEKTLTIPVAFQVQARTVLLSLVNAGLLSVQETAMVLGIHAAHCRELARKLASQDVVESLVDKRQGQKRDTLFTPEVKSELVQQFVVNALSGWPTSGQAIKEDLQQRCGLEVSERSVRLHLNKLEIQKKRSSGS